MSHNHKYKFNKFRSRLSLGVGSGSEGLCLSTRASLPPPPYLPYLLSPPCCLDRLVSNVDRVAKVYKKLLNSKRDRFLYIREKKSMQQ